MQSGSVHPRLRNETCVFTCIADCEVASKPLRAGKPMLQQGIRGGGRLSTAKTNRTWTSLCRGSILGPDACLCLTWLLEALEILQVPAQRAPEPTEI